MAAEGHERELLAVWPHVVDDDADLAQFMDEPRLLQIAGLEQAVHAPVELLGGEAPERVPEPALALLAENRRAQVAALRLRVAARLVVGVDRLHGLGVLRLQERGQVAHYATSRRCEGTSTVKNPWRPLAGSGSLSLRTFSSFHA